MHNRKTRLHLRVVNGSALRFVLHAVLGLASVLACSEFSRSADSSSPASGNAGTDDDSVNGEGPGAQNPGSEQELEASFLAPAISGTKVWTANPDSGQVALIDAETLEVRMANAGYAPTYLSALPKTDDNAPNAALVINERGDNAAHLRHLGEAIDVTLIATHSGANTWATSTDARFAIAWTDYRKVANADATDGFQDLTVIALDSDAPTRLSVGYRPVKVQFNQTATRAFVVTEPGITVLDLTGKVPTASDFIEVSAGGVTLSNADDVSITPDASFALIRVNGDAKLYIVDLNTGSQSSLSLGGPITDVDLSADGTTAIAVVREPTPKAAALAHDAGTELEAGTVDGGGSVLSAEAGIAADASPDAEAPTADGSADAAAPTAFDSGLPGADATPANRDASPNDLDAGAATTEPGSQVVRLSLTPSGVRVQQTVTVAGERFGSASLARDGSVAALYTNAEESDRITILNFNDAGPSLPPRTVQVKSAVLAVFVSDDGEHAISFQGPAANAIGNKGAFSIVSLRRQRSPKIIGTPARPSSLALLPASPSSSALVTISDAASGVFATYLVAMPALSAEMIRLAGEPLATGIVSAANKGLVAQKHAEGRLTLVDLETAKAQTLTGFELAAKVVE